MEDILSRIRICKKCGQEFIREPYALKQEHCLACIPAYRRTNNTRPIRGHQIQASLSLDDIAAEIGLSKERVRQIESRALRKFRLNLLRMYPELYREYMHGVYTA